MSSSSSSATSSSSSSLPIFSPVILLSSAASSSSASVIDPDIALFRQASASYCAHEVRSLMAPFPLIYQLQHHIVTMFNMCHVCNALFYKILKTDEFKISEKLCLALYQFKVRKDPAEIVALLTQCHQATQILGKSGDLISSLGGLFREWIAPFKTNRLDLFKKSILELQGFSYDSYTPEEKYRFAVKSYQAVYRSFNLVAGMVGAKSEELQQSAEAAKQFMNNRIHILRLNHQALTKDTRLTRMQKVELSSLCVRLFRTFVQEYERYVFLLGNVLFTDLYKNYFPVIQSDIVDKIAATNENPLENFEVFDRYYVDNHRDVYEGFLPRVEEFQNAFLPVMKTLTECGRLLQNFHLYIKFGDLGHLCEQLDARGKKTAEKVIREELLAFNAQMEMEPLASQVKAYLADPKLAVVTEMQSYFAPSDRLFGEFGRLLKNSLEDSLECAKQHTKELYLFPRHVSRPTVRPRILLSTSSTSSSAVQTVPEEVDLVETSSASSSQETVHSPTPFERLDRVHQLLAKNHAILKRGHGWFGTADALDNAQGHLQNLLSVMHRMLQQSVAGLTKGDVHALIVDYVRYTTLAAEQMLSAMDRESNQIKSQEELKDRLTHDLYGILLKCQFPGKIMNHDLRAWIQQASRGEILVRDPSQCKLGVSSLQTLLAKTWYYVTGNETFKAQDILHDAVQFCKRGIDTCIELQEQIIAVKERSLKIDPLKQELANLFRSLSNAILQEPVEDFPVHLMGEISSVSSSSSTSSEPTPIEKIGRQIRDWQTQLRFVGEENVLDNLCSHLLPHLETEVNSVQSLNPAHVHLHAGNVFLSNQMILEEAFHVLLSYRSPIEISEENRHNLMQMALALGMKSNAFTAAETEFLNTGKAIRQIVRYTSSYETSHLRSRLSPLIEEMLSVMKDSKVEPKLLLFSRDLGLDQGFKMANSSAHKIVATAQRAVHKNLSLLASILEKVLNQHSRGVGDVRTEGVREVHAKRGGRRRKS